MAYLYGFCGDAVGGNPNAAYLDLVWPVGAAWLLSGPLLVCDSIINSIYDTTVSMRAASCSRQYHVQCYVCTQRLVVLLYFRNSKTRYACSSHVLAGMSSWSKGEEARGFTTIHTSIST